MITPMVNYGLIERDFFCPADPTYPVNTKSLDGAAYVASNILLLAGLYEDTLDLTSKAMNSYWMDSNPSAAHRRLEDAPQKIMLSDYNFWATWNGGTFYSNHGGGEVLGPVDMSVNLIKGGNRIYADGHGEWVNPDVMGKNFSPVSMDPFDSHFSHMSGALRPYWW